MTKYFRFNGLATRSEFWGVSIIGFIAAFAIAFMFGFISSAGGVSELIGSLGLLATMVAAAWLSLATGVRRCRDAGINVWWTLGTILPYVGWIVLIVIGCLPTDPVDESPTFQ